MIAICRTLLPSCFVVYSHELWKKIGEDHKLPLVFCVLGLAVLSMFPCFAFLCATSLGSMENHSENTTVSGKHPPPPPSCVTICKSLSSLFVCNASHGLFKECMCERMSPLFDVLLLTMTILFVDPNLIDTNCNGQDAAP